MFNVPPSFLVVTVACGIWLAVWLVDHRGRRVADVLDHPTRPGGVAPAEPAGGALLQPKSVDTGGSRTPA
jgi:zinc/manganese transport system permease protein